MATVKKAKKSLTKKVIESILVPKTKVKKSSVSPQIIEEAIETKFGNLTKICIRKCKDNVGFYTDRRGRNREFYYFSEICNIYKNILGSKEKLENTDVVFYDKHITSIIPKVRIKKLYGCKHSTTNNETVNTIVLDPDKYNPVCIQVSELDTKTYTIKDCGDTLERQMEKAGKSWDDISEAVDKHYEYRTSIRSYDYLIDSDQINELLSIIESEKKIINASSIVLNDENLELDDSAFKRIVKMYKSEETGMYKLANTLVSCYNITEKNKARISYLMTLSNELNEEGVRRPTEVLFLTSLIKEAFSDYDNSLGDSDYLLTLMSYRKDPVLEEVVQEDLKASMGIDKDSELFGKFRIEII